jgi:hypothetical protein
MRLAVSALSVVVVLGACAGPDIKGASSCAELEEAWEAAGGLDAEESVHRDTMERLNELGARDLSVEDVVMCSDLFLKAQAALDCRDPRLSLPETFCF